MGKCAERRAVLRAGRRAGSARQEICRLRVKRRAGCTSQDASVTRRQTRWFARLTRAWETRLARRVRALGRLFFFPGGRRRLEVVVRRCRRGKQPGIRYGSLQDTAHFRNRPNSGYGPFQVPIQKCSTQDSDFYNDFFSNGLVQDTALNLLAVIIHSSLFLRDRGFSMYNEDKIASQAPSVNTLPSEA